MVKILVNILFLFILAMTILPVKQVGCLLHSHQLKEESTDTDASENVTVVKFMAKDFILHHDSFQVTDFSLSLVKSLHCHLYHGLLLWPPVDIHCPPPNVFVA